jgi:hypothetical protein
MRAVPDNDKAVGFYYQGGLADLPRRVASSLHTRFVGHAAAGEWRLIWNPVRDGVELIVALPADVFTTEALGDLVEILEDHAMRPLTGMELDDAIGRAERAISAARGDPRL